MSSNITKTASANASFNFLSSGKDDPYHVTIDDRITCGQVVNKLSSIMECIPYRDRRIIALYYFYDWTFTKIGNELNMSRHAARRLHDKALQDLRDKMPEYFISDSDLALEAA